jgi:hypothetical protein
MALEQITAHASRDEIDFGLSVNIDRNCAGCRLTLEISDAFQRLGSQCSQVYRVRRRRSANTTLPRGKAAVVFPRL